MPDTKLSDMTDISSVQSTDLLYVVRSGNPFKTTVGELTTAIQYQAVTNFAALPSATTHSGETYLALNPQGVIWVNRKPAGLYTSDGTNWNYDADQTDAYLAGLTPTNGQIPVGNGTNFVTKSISGDATLAASGALTVAQAAKLTTARNIDGQSFDGSANVTVIAPGTHAASSKSTPIDADEFPVVDSAAGNTLAKLTWANLKATLKTYFDAIYLAAVTWASLGAGTSTSSETFGENVEKILVAALSADGKYCGITEGGTAGEALSVGYLCYLKASDSKWYRCDATTATTSAGKLGFCVLAASTNGATKMLYFGKIRADAQFPTLSVNAPVYATTTAGAISTTQPSGTDQVIRIVGFGNTTHELHVCISNDYMTHT